MNTATFHRILALLALTTSSLTCLGASSQDSFGGWSVCQDLYDYVRKILPEGKTMVELGSGYATGEFAKHYTVWSVEQDEKWLNKYSSHYIHAPIVHGWYDTAILRAQLPKNYDLLLVDGPIGHGSRWKILQHIELFRQDVPILVDDAHRDLDTVRALAQQLARSFEVIKCARFKSFAIIHVAAQ